jgi:hypothetical protein
MTSALEEGEWSAARPGRTLPPGKTRYPLYRRLGGPQGRSRQARKTSPPTGIRSLDRPARSHSLYRLSYPALTQGEQEHLNPTTHGVLHFVFRPSQAVQRSHCIHTHTHTHTHDDAGQVITCLNYSISTNTCHDTFATDTCSGNTFI